ncbi:hypothetical protein LUZ60_014492 [Juncus effusus]|nr:hypothetical protein LUZ60_014492 [Juncus effusus]
MTNTRSRITEEEITELLSKLHALLPEARRRGAHCASASKLLKETCNYIKSLHRDMDDLSDQLSVLMAGMEVNGNQADIIQSLLH